MTLNWGLGQDPRNKYVNISATKFITAKWDKYPINSTTVCFSLIFISKKVIRKHQITTYCKHSATSYPPGKGSGMLQPCTGSSEARCLRVSVR